MLFLIGLGFFWTPLFIVAFVPIGLWLVIQVAALVVELWTWTDE